MRFVEEEKDNKFDFSGVKYGDLVVTHEGTNFYIVRAYEGVKSICLAVDISNGNADYNHNVILDLCKNIEHDYAIKEIIKGDKLVLSVEE